MTLISGARVVAPGGVLDPGWVRIDGDRITAVGSGPAPADPDVLDAAGRWLVPGFVDLHVHGGGGYAFTASCEDITAGTAFHRGHGTTTSLVSLVTAPIPRLCEQLARVAELTHRPGSRIAGAHLEGPFLARARCGAHNPRHLAAPDRAVLATLLEAGRGTVRSVTVAPELPGALEVIGDVVAAGAIAAIGHTDADYDCTRAAVDAGATLATHLFNAMPGLGHRHPGPVAAVLDAGLAYEIINDGTHVDPAVVRLVARADPDRLVLVTDAIEATGVGDGDYRLGDQAVRVRAGAARLRDTDRLAGSTLTMDVAFRRAVREIGLTVPQAVAAAATTPAGLLGLGDRIGAVTPGLTADLLVLDDDLQVVEVLLAGRRR